jgi:hypothetical protein
LLSRSRLSAPWDIPSVSGEVSAIASAHAPFIYFDGAPNFGAIGGIANITLEAVRHNSVGGKVLFDRVTVAHLRMGLGALQSLKEAIAGIELILAKPPTEGKPN